MDKQNERWNKETAYLLIVSAFLGAAWFIFLYGVKIIDVTNDSWIVGAESDIVQHYLGWCFYRNSDWHILFGLVDGITYPSPVSIIYMDSIPLFAVIFKILSPLLPETFQYFGLYGLVSFVLQACLAALIMNHYSKNKPLSVLFGYLTLMYPVIFQRMFDHTALGGHWIIFLGIYVWCMKKEDCNIKTECIRWGITLSLAVFLHPYFVVMIAVMMVCSLLEDCFNGKWKMAAGTGIISVAAALFWLFMLGGFYGNSEVIEERLGEFSANLNCFYNSQGTGILLPRFKTYFAGQAEGLAYLGAGCLLAVAAAAVILLCTWKANITKRKKFVFLYMVIMMVLALSPTITFHDHLLLKIPYPSFIINVLSIFRASGRFAWPVAYFAILGAFVIFADFFNSRFLVLLTLCVIGLQFYDVYGYENNRADYARYRNVPSTLQSEIWDNLSEDYKEIAFINDNGQYDAQLISNIYGLNEVFDVMEYAAKKHMVLNDGYVSRRDIEAINEAKKESWDELVSGMPDKEKIYIFHEMPYAIGNSLHLYYADNFIIGVTEPIEGMEELADTVP